MIFGRKGLVRGSRCQEDVNDLPETWNANKRPRYSRYRRQQVRQSRLSPARPRASPV